MSTSQALPLQIDIVSDVVCPWCVLGYLQLETALARMPGVFAVNVCWHPFELNPQMPPEGEELSQHLARKLGPGAASSSRGTRDRLQQLGKAVGFHFDYFDGMRVVNTFRAHQLLHWARDSGLQTRLQLVLFRYFFSERQDVSDPQVLVRAASEAGLPSDEARTVLEDARFAKPVREAQRRWLERDVTAVPSFFFEGSYPVPGAQDPATFERILRKLQAVKTDLHA